MFFAAIVGCSDKPPRQLYEKAGAFSYDPPPGWQVVEAPGLKYRISHGPRVNEFAPNINVVDEIFQGTLAEYVEANLKNMGKYFVNFKVLKRENLKTQDNEDVVKFITENLQQKTMLRQYFFFIGSGKRKYVFTCTTLPTIADELSKVFEKSMNTFRIH